MWTMIRITVQWSPIMFFLFPILLNKSILIVISAESLLQLIAVLYEQKYWKRIEVYRGEILIFRSATGGGIVHFIIFAMEQLFEDHTRSFVQQYERGLCLLEMDGWMCKGNSWEGGGREELSSYLLSRWVLSFLLLLLLRRCSWLEWWRYGDSLLTDNWAAAVVGLEHSELFQVGRNWIGTSLRAVKFLSCCG